MHTLEDYKGFKLDRKHNFITFYHPDMEEGSGEWSGSALCPEDAYEMIDEMTQEEMDDLMDAYWMETQQ